MVDGANFSSKIANDGNHNSNEILFVNDPDQFPHVILKGSMANLSALRQGDADIRATFFAERYGGGTAAQEYDDDDEEEDEEANHNSSVLLMESSIPALITLGSSDGSNSSNSNISGEIFVTSSQVLFVARDQEQMDHDMAIGASCIVLHAMTEEPQLAIYLQLNDPSASNDIIMVVDNNNDGDGEGENGNDGGPLEVTITPAEGSDCQTIFNCLCKLVSMHPIMDDDDQDDDWQGGFGSGDDDDQLIWAPAIGSALGTGLGMHGENEEDGDGATEEERSAMLERLDNLLVVRPEFAIQEGQFDDAEIEGGRV